MQNNLLHVITACLLCLTPYLNFAQSPDCTISGNGTMCEGQTTQLCAPEGPGYTYDWDTGSSSRCITVNGQGTYHVTVTDADGNRSYCSKVVTVVPRPSCGISGNTTICTGQSTELCAPVGTGYTYLWSTSATTRCVTVSTAGTYYVTVTNSNGCSKVCSKTVNITQPPVCTISGSGVICNGESTQLCASSGYGYTYLWSTGATKKCITVNAAGTYFVTVTNSGGCSSVCSKTVTVSPAPACTITGNFVMCEGQTTQLCAPEGTGYTYDWDTGSSARCITVNGQGTYHVTVTDANGCRSYCSQVVTVVPRPSCGISGNTTICEGQSTELCAAAGTGYTYLWSTSATTQCITTSAAGTYYVTVTNSNGCTKVCSKTVTVGPPPVCTISGSGVICDGESTQLCAPHGYGYTYLWSTGATTKCLTVSVAGTYSVTVTNSGGCSSICSKEVTTSPAPDCTITGNFVMCEGQTTQLCAPEGAGYTYDWDTGSSARCITVNGQGTYHVTVTDANGCRSYCSQVVTVVLRPSCGITGNTTICEGQSTELCAAVGTGYTYLWSTSATTQCITTSAAGTYYVTVTNSNGCTKVCSKTVNITPPPVCTISGSGVICDGESTQLCAPHGYGYTYLWSTGATTKCLTVSVAGTYFVTVTNSGGCSSICSKEVTVSPAPACTITGNFVMCEGQTTQLCAPEGAGYTYDWDTGSSARCITVNGQGTYHVTVTDANGCRSYCSQVVTVVPRPSCGITGNTTICEGQSTELCAAAGTGYTYLWSTSATTQCITTSAAGTYYVTVTNSNGCTKVCSKTVTVGPPPVCTISGSGVICDGESTQLCAPHGYGYTYLWSTGATTKCLTVTVAGTYSVTVTNSGGCSSICSKEVTVSPAPDCTITGNFVMCEGQTTQLCAPEGAGYTYDWDTGSSARCITVNGQGTYHVTVTDANGCRSYCSQVVTVVPRPSCGITGNTTICEGESTELCAPVGTGYTYLWSTSATTRCITTSTAGTYYVTVTNSSGCSKTCSKTVIVRQAPVCSITGELNPEPGEPTTLCAPSGLSSYQWNTGATTKCITVNTGGTYSVTITNSSGCTSSCSVTVSYDFGRDASGGNITPVVGGNFTVKAYPNPFSAKAIIEFQNMQANSHVVIEIFNLAGIKITTLFDSDVEKGVLYKAEIEAENLPEGIYMYRVLNEDQIISGKLLLIK